MPPIYSIGSLDRCAAHTKGSAQRYTRDDQTGTGTHITSRRGARPTMRHVIDRRHVDLCL